MKMERIQSLNLELEVKRLNLDLGLEVEKEELYRSNIPYCIEDLVLKKVDV